MSERDFALLALLAILIFGAVVVILPVRREMSQKQERLAELQAQKSALDKELRLLEKGNDLLRKGDPYALMRVARETYRYCYPGEKIYHFSQSDKDAPPTATVVPPTPAPPPTANP